MTDPALKLLITLVAAALCGCATAGREIDVSRLSQIKKGETTRAQVDQLLGPPNGITQDADGNTTYTYSFASARVKGQTFIPIYGAFAGGSDVTTQTTTVTFGPDSKVTDYKYTTGAASSRMGQTPAHALPTP